MTRRLKRTRNFDITLQIKRDDFIRPPREPQRNWLLNKAITEFTDDLEQLDRLSRRFVAGVDALQTGDRTQAPLSDAEIMEDWQIPLMQAMADIVTAAHGHVLEIGFGRGIASTMIQAGGVDAHTIIECNDSVVERFHAWKKEYPGRDIRLLHGLWQDVLQGAGKFDGIFFHTYPLNESDFVEQIAESITFAEHFFEPAARHLVDGGVFTYLSNEIDSLSRGHQRRLLQHFRSIEISVIGNLDLPDDIRDAWWADSMVLVRATR